MPHSVWKLERIIEVTSGGFGLAGMTSVHLRARTRLEINAQQFKPSPRPAPPSPSRGRTSPLVNQNESNEFRPPIFRLPGPAMSQERGSEALWCLSRRAVRKNHRLLVLERFSAMLRHILPPGTAQLTIKRPTAPPTSSTAAWSRNPGKNSRGKRPPCAPTPATTICLCLLTLSSPSPASSGTGSPPGPIWKRATSSW